MRIAVLGSPRSFYLADLRRAARDRHEVVSVPFRELSCRVTPQGARVLSAGVCLNDADAVLVRTMAPGSLEQVVFRMDALAALESAGTLVVNPPRAIEAAVDKQLATLRLQAAGLTVPRTIVCQTVDDAMEAFSLLGGDVVLKPIFGSEGRGIMRLTDPDLARRAFRLLIDLGAALYVQEFVPHRGYDLRILQIGEKLLAMKRQSESDWRTNASRGAVCEPFDLSPELADIARRSTDAIGAPLAGVDLLPALDGRLYALEVNAVPGWKALAAALRIDVAALVLEFLQATVARR
ncbi:MAG: RimK family alpha-L-glutamate ligase [Planctomycetia bacterium]|nr:RimK family alpha-L-glutamate ligase [Planctomycetia bacterium]